MIKAVIKQFIPEYHNTKDRNVRERYCVLAGALGILCNLVLFAVKLTIGRLMNSISILSDAFNNLSDMGSSVISILGAKMSNRRPDRGASVRAWTDGVYRVLSRCLYYFYCRLRAASFFSR